MQVEPHLQPLSSELLHHKTAKHEDDARVDIRAAGFWDCRHYRSFLIFGFLTLLLSLTSLLVQLQLSGDMRLKNVGLMRSVSRKWKGEVLHHLCFPLQGVWAKLPQSLTNGLLPFLATNGTLHIRWLWDGCVAPWDFPYSATL